MALAEGLRDADPKVGPVRGVAVRGVASTSVFQPPVVGALGAGWVRGVVPKEGVVVLRGVAGAWFVRGAAGAGV